MKLVRPLSVLLTFAFGVLATQVFSYSSYQMAPSTGEDLPFSVQSRTLLKHLFDNRNILGGQVIALRDQPGRQYSGNYIDIGDIGGVKRDDVFALFTPHGEPVGFIRIVDLQRFTSSFEFMELTVDPTNDLIVKKLSSEIQSRLPEKLFAYPNMRHFHKQMHFVSNKSAMPNQTNGSSAAAGQTPLPPLPSEDTTSSSTSNLPPLPESGVASAGLEYFIGSRSKFHQRIAAFAHR